MHYTHQENLTADTTYTFGANLTVISVDKDASDAPTAMGTGGWIGSSTTSINIAIAGNDRSVLMHGITLRNGGGSTAKEIRVASGAGTVCELENCLLWCGTANGASVIRLTNSFEGYAVYRNCTFRFNNNTQALGTFSFSRLINCNIDTGGAIPSPLFVSSASVTSHFECIGCDFSAITGTVVPNISNHSTFRFDRCSFGNGATAFGTQTSNPNLASSDAWFHDCIFGTTRRTAHYNALGSSIINTGTYFTSGAAGLSLEVTTTANASFRAPYKGPFIDFYNTGTSAVTPYFEVLRNNGTATAYNDAQVWAEFSYKNTASSPLANGLVVDEQAIGPFVEGTAGTAQAAGAGTGSWTIASSNSPASFKCDSGGSITPTEAGYIRGRIVVAQPSITIFVDPQIRT